MDQVSAYLACLQSMLLLLLKVLIELLQALVKTLLLVLKDAVFVFLESSRYYEHETYELLFFQTANHLFSLGNGSLTC